MRFYTRFQPSIEVAIEHHIILAQIRHAVISRISATSKRESINHDEFIAGLHEALADSNVSESDLGLSVLVGMQATWIIGSTWISSPVLSFAEALEVRNRLLSARCSGWEALRTEWITLMQHASYVRGWRRTAAEAEAHADEVWVQHRLVRDAIEHRRHGHTQQLAAREELRAKKRQAQAERLIQRQLRRQRRIEQRERQRLNLVLRSCRRFARIAALHARRLAHVEARCARCVVALEAALKHKEQETRAAALRIEASARCKEAALRRCQMQKRREQKCRKRVRWQWLRRTDLTMEEILVGMPKHLKRTCCD